LARATRTCRDRLAGAGVDLSAYNTFENAADLADRRNALRIVEWNVFGVSYRTDLAHSYVRDHPGGIRSLTIASVVPPSVATLGWGLDERRWGFHNLFRACAAQPRCAKRYPGSNEPSTVSSVGSTAICSPHSHVRRRASGPSRSCSTELHS
jgi:pimeloyl-ACP methyl ester carboxylesterase